MTQQTIVLDEKRNVTLTCYLQPVGGKFEYVEKRPAMLILPGGAYQYCSDREADPVAFAFLQGDILRLRRQPWECSGRMQRSLAMP